VTRALVLAALAACYDPTPPPQACSETGQCPTGQRCDFVSRECVGELPPVAELVQIDAGGHHTCGIDRDAALWCWGDNSRGSLGTGDFDDRNRPVQIGQPGWQSVSAGDVATCAIRTDGGMFCWGPGDDTGIPGVGDTNTPTFVPGGPWSTVSVGFEGSCALTQAGALFCKDDHVFETPPQPFDLHGVAAVQVATSFHHRCVIDDHQALYCWGKNDQGQLGNTMPGDEPAPVAILPERRWLAVATANETTCAIDTDNGLWCWGRCDSGQTGTGVGPQSGCPVPAQVGADRYVSVDATDRDTCAVRDDGAMVCFGTNDAGQLGDLGDTSPFEPHVMPVVGGWRAVAIGTLHVCGLREGDEAWCWGRNEAGELGDGTPGFVATPTAVASDVGWQQVAVARRSTCAIASDGSAWCWGINVAGQLGDGSTVSRSRPARVRTESNWLALAPGAHHTCGLRAGGELWCWGKNDLGVLGDGLTADEPTPERIMSALDGFERVASGELHSCAVRTGSMLCWGQNFGSTPIAIGASFGAWSSPSASGGGAGPEGEDACGIAGAMVYCWNGTEAPTLNDNSKAWTQFSAGYEHGCGLQGATAFCFGKNASGQLGNNSTATADPAVPVVGGLAWSSIAAGNNFTCGITSDTKLYCWGFHRSLGRVTNDDALVPVQVDNNAWLTVAAGEHHACAIRRDDSALYCWGFDDFGELGLGGGGGDRPKRVAAPGAP